MLFKKYHINNNFKPISCKYNILIVDCKVKYDRNILESDIKMIDNFDGDQNLSLFKKIKYINFSRDYNKIIKPNILPNTDAHKINEINNNNISYFIHNNLNLKFNILANVFTNIQEPEKNEWPEDFIIKEDHKK